jgi:hypothetical protein
VEVPALTIQRHRAKAGSAPLARVRDQKIAWRGGRRPRAARLQPPVSIPIGHCMIFFTLQPTSVWLRKITG